MQKILSVDWDYFFTDDAPYDWGHRETMFFLEMIWPVRLTNVNMLTGKEAFIEYVPTIPKDFWKIVKNKPSIFVAESHASIAQMIGKNSIVTNLDAHHNCGYGNIKTLECGNWAYMAGKKIKEYHLCYPTWREEGQEHKPSRKPTSTIKGLPEPADYDVIFVCRSGCWTPPWWDLKFREWLDQSGLDVTLVDDYVKKNRSPNLEEAKVIKTNLDAQFREMQKQHPMLVA